MAEYELYHSRKGSERKNHKYIFRTWKNGKWFYVYKNGRKYNRIQDWLGKDEKDAAFNPNDETVRYRQFSGERVVEPSYTVGYNVHKNVAKDMENNAKEWESDARTGKTGRLTKNETLKGAAAWRRMANREYDDYGKKYTEHQKNLKAYYKTPLGKIDKTASKIKKGANKIKKTIKNSRVYIKNGRLYYTDGSTVYGIGPERK